MPKRVWVSSLPKSYSNASKPLSACHEVRTRPLLSRKAGGGRRTRARARKCDDDGGARERGAGWVGGRLSLVPLILGRTKVALYKASEGKSTLACGEIRCVVAPLRVFPQRHNGRQGAGCEAGAPARAAGEGCAQALRVQRRRRHSEHEVRGSGIEQNVDTGWNKNGVTFGQTSLLFPFGGEGWWGRLEPTRAPHAMNTLCVQLGQPYLALSQKRSPPRAYPLIFLSHSVVYSPPLSSHFLFQNLSHIHRSSHVRQVWRRQLHRHGGLVGEGDAARGTAGSRVGVGPVRDGGALRPRWD